MPLDELLKQFQTKLDNNFDTQTLLDAIGFLDEMRGHLADREHSFRYY